MCAIATSARAVERLFDTSPLGPRRDHPRCGLGGPAWSVAEGVGRSDAVAVPVVQGCAGSDRVVTRGEVRGTVTPTAPVTYGPTDATSGARMGADPQARVITVNGHTPRIHDDAWVAPGAVVAGNVTLAAGVSVWFGCVLRAEEGPITIGADTNIQDNGVVHADPDHPVVVGARVTVGHRVVVHGCEVDDDVLVGMGAILLNGARVGARSVVGANGLVTESMTVDADTVVVGSPARPRDLALPEVPRSNVAAYLRLASWYARQPD